MKKIIYLLIWLLIPSTFSTISAQVGVGTVTPRGAFEISSATNGIVLPQIALTSTTTSAPVVNPQTSDVPIASTLIYNTATAGSGGTAVTPGYYYWDGTLWVRLTASTGTTSSWSLTGNTGTTAGTNFIGTTDSRDLVIKTNNVEHMRFEIGGDIGLGTSTPTSKLDVNTGTTTNNTIVNATGTINDYLQYNIKNLSTGTRAQSGYTATADNGSDTSGFAWLGINNSAFNYPTDYNIGLANDVTYIGSGQDLYIANANKTKSIIFSTGKSGTPFFNERMRLTNAGNLGIGTATPDDKVTVAGSVSPSANGTYNLGNTTNRWNTVYATTGTINTSDRREKTHITNLSYGLKEILGLRPVSYNWKKTPDTDKMLGLIAQEVREVVPEIVIGDETKEILGMKYTELIPVLINAIKEQQQQIETLKRDIELLKAKK